MATQHAIELRELTKTFGEVVAMTGDIEIEDRVDFASFVSSNVKQKAESYQLLTSFTDAAAWKSLTTKLMSYMLPAELQEIETINGKDSIHVCFNFL